MSTEAVFISHATKDDEFVKELRFALEGQGIPVWVDSRNLRGGDQLAPEVEQAIEQARQVLAVLSPNTINSLWVRKEIRKALQVAQKRKNDGYWVIPLLLSGVEPSALALWFDEEPVAVPIRLGPGGLSEALPAILTALGEYLPTDLQPFQSVESQPVEELLLKLSDAEIRIEEGKSRVSAMAALIYEPANPTIRTVESTRFRFTALLGPIEAEDLRWYLESYYLWPMGVFKERAERIEAQFPQWGQALYQAVSAPQVTQEVLTAWQQATEGKERRFSVLVDSDLPEGASQEQQAATREAASHLLSPYNGRTPWKKPDY